MAVAVIDTPVPDSLEALEPLVHTLAHQLTLRGWMLATAESCTGGLVAGACTQVAGSSDWFDRGFVTYSNDAKTTLLGVPSSLIDTHGAVSAEVARAMALGSLAHSQADVAVSVTGVAGPGGGSPTKPVGTVWTAWARRGEDRATATLLQLSGDRRAIRLATVQAVFQQLLRLSIP